MKNVIGTLKHNPNEYIILIRFSENRHLLVEGSDDKKFFARLISELDSYHPQGKKIAGKPDIDTAEELVGFQRGLGNREKIELINNMIREEDSNRFVGFVDREFRNFEISETIQDLIPSHSVYKRLVWSRGHSVENYFFDLGILGELFKDHTPADWFDKVVSIFYEIVEPTLKLACALSLAGYEIQRFDFVKSSISWKNLEVKSSDSQVNLCLDDWSNELSNRSNFSPTEILSLVERYSFWREKLETTNIKTLRWLCHGHIGMTVIWAAYICCIHAAFPNYEKRKITAVVGSVNGIGEPIRFQALTGCLARKILTEKCEYPKEVLELLGFILL